MKNVCCSCFFLFASVCYAEMVILQGPSVTQNASIYSAREARDKNFSKLVISKGNVKYNALLRFDLADLSTDKQIKDAVVLLYLNKQYHDNPLRLRAKTNPVQWDENDITYNKFMAGSSVLKNLSENVIATFKIGPHFGRGWVVLRSPKLTELVTSWVSGKQPNYGLVLDADSSSGKGPSMTIFSEKHNSQKTQQPKLIVSYGEPIDVTRYGFVSDDELIRIPLREQLNSLRSKATLVNVDIASEIAEIKKHIEKLKSVNSTVDINNMEKQLTGLHSRIVSAICPDQKIIIWPIKAWKTISYDQLPQPGTLNIHRKMLLKEFSDVCYAMTNVTTKSQTVEIKIDLPDDLNEKNVEVRSSYWLKARKIDASRENNAIVYLEEPLPRLERKKIINLKPCETRRLWITLNSNDIKAGNYTIGVNFINHDRKNIASSKLTLDVLPNALEKDPKLSVFSYAYLQRPSTKDYRTYAIADLKAHYENTFVVNIFKLPKVGENGEIIEKADFSGQTEYYLQYISDARRVLFFWNGDGQATNVTFGGKLKWLSMPWRKAMKSWITDWYNYLNKQGFPDDRIVMYPFDESYDNKILGQTEYKALGEMADELHKINPGILVFANPVAFKSSDMVAMRKLTGKIDIWSVNSPLLYPGSYDWPCHYTEADKAKFLPFFTGQQKQGKEVWSYMITQQGTKPTDYLEFAWRAWQKGITGLGLWSYNDIRGGTCWDAVLDDFTMIYEQRDAPADIPRVPDEPYMPSISWQAHRAGVQDYLLLQQVRRHYPELKDKLDDIVKKVLNNPADPDRYEEARMLLLEIIAAPKTN